MLAESTVRFSCGDGFHVDGVRLAKVEDERLEILPDGRARLLSPSADANRAVMSVFSTAAVGAESRLSDMTCEVGFHYDVGKSYKTLWRLRFATKPKTLIS